MDFSPLLILLKWQDTAHANIGCLRMVMCSNTIKNRGEALFLGSGIKLICMVFGRKVTYASRFSLPFLPKSATSAGLPQLLRGA